MSPTENSNQVFLPGGATNSQNSPYISVWPLDHYCDSRKTSLNTKKEKKDWLENTGNIVRSEKLYVKKKTDIK